jgi:hypothetical protein
MAVKKAPHFEEAVRRASGRTHRRRTRPILVAAALLVVACTPEPEAVGPPAPNGSREPLHAGFWQGEMGGTLVDFHVDQVSPRDVDVHISGVVIQQLPKALQPPGYQPYFYDRPKICSRRADGRTFDCPHYADMHIDNGLLCGAYVMESQVFHPCFKPVAKAQ